MRRFGVNRGVATPQRRAEVDTQLPAGLYETEKDPLGFSSFPYHFTRLGTHCYGVVDDKGLANVGVIDTSDGLVFVDSSLHPFYSRRIVELVINILNKPVSYLVNTHFHRDHTGGNTEIPARNGRVAHTKSALMLQNFGTKHFADGGGIFSQLPICLPDITFDDRSYVLPVRPVVEIIHVGGHTHDSCIVHCPSDDIVFAGDALFTNCAPYVSFWSCGNGFGSALTWIKSLQTVIDLQPRAVMAGHGPVSTVRDVCILKDFFEYYASLTSNEKQKAHSLKETWQGIIRSKDFLRTDFDPEVYLYLIIALYQEL